MVSDSPDLESRFYADLPVFSDFSGIGDDAAYRPLPESWSLLACDIVRSSDAIAAGRYKDVNMVGAAAIAAVLNVSKGTELPFVFGGDGAMIAVPGSLKEKASAALAGVRRMAGSVLGLALRAASFPVGDLSEAGGALRVRKFELSPGNHLAMFAGGGLEVADTLLKDEAKAAAYLIGEEVESDAALDGLSCRWEPLPARNGRIVSLMVRPTSAGLAAGYDLPALIAGLEAILGSSLVERQTGAEPVRKETLRHRFPPSGLMREVRVVGFRSGQLKTFAKALFECAAAAYAYATARRVGPFDPVRYVGELQQNTDFRKFDDTLRLVLDLTVAQVDVLSAYLEGEYRRGRLVYGLHGASSALMTCLVFSLEQSRHIHFVDGGDGGFSEAAREFKERVALLDAKERAN
ncbi:DUF3095 domain-containing protein [Stappia sp. F7233]|uniref:DUF3095 domain-containing protein n=1 Tax=Stappia albiluteola TaxID=2758565 RepID=A0A839AB15_9HYPH|nr:DUF3095 domain-containing protein [Stappia albiluteola]MBA5776325.1 DUF3095 domain-containing protein [Stappia albiluteola]